MESFITDANNASRYARVPRPKLRQTYDDPPNYLHLRPENLPEPGDRTVNGNFLNERPGDLPREIAPKKLQAAAMLEAFGLLDSTGNCLEALRASPYEQAEEFEVERGTLLRTFRLDLGELFRRVFKIPNQFSKKNQQISELQNPRFGLSAFGAPKSAGRGQVGRGRRPGGSRPLRDQRELHREHMLRLPA